MMDPCWDADKMSLFLKREGDVTFGYMIRAFVSQIEWPTSDMTFCTYCGSRVKRGVDCPNCGSSWGMQPPPDKAVVSIHGYMPGAGHLMDLPARSEIDILHKCSGCRDNYREDEVAVHIVVDKVMRQLIYPLGELIYVGDRVMLELELLASVMVNWQQVWYA